mgnify:FL=1
MSSNTADTLAFDPDRLRDRYRAERDRRLRSDGNAQYLAVTGELGHYVDDPYVETAIEREPLNDEVEIVIIGGGFGGLIAGARLRESGFEDIRIIEKAADFGGTWYWNRYPGAQCDIEAYVYLPLLEEMGYLPTEKYAHQPEIRRHAVAIANRYKLYDKACLQTRVTDMRWEEASQRWRLATDRGDTISARYVLMSTGPLNQPKLPGIPGITGFRGHTFHTSRWDYAYTGGDSSGGLDRLADKRVAVIGTGATAVQCVPHLGAAAKQLYVFQRTPSSIDERGNSPTDRQWASTLKPGWHQDRVRNFSTVVTGNLADRDLVADGWTDLFRKLMFNFQHAENPDLSPAGIARAMELADFEKMEEIRARAEALVNDPDTAEALKPWYRQFCKRPCFHDEYLLTFNRPNVSLVDTAGKGVDRITAKGVVANGVEYEVDCIIYATGFEVGTGFVSRNGYEICGVDGLHLSEKWHPGVSTLHGLQSNGFPNCFFMGNLQSGFSPNFTHMLDENARHITHILAQARDAGWSRIEATAAAEQGWVRACQETARDIGDFFEQCTPGYYNNEGKPGERSGQNSWYGGGCDEYFRILAQWRAAGDFEGLTVS